MEVDEDPAEAVDTKSDFPYHGDIDFDEEDDASESNSEYSAGLQGLDVSDDSDNQYLPSGQSDSLEPSSATSSASDEDPSRANQKKRKRKFDPSASGALKRPDHRQNYHHSYRKLYNETVEAAKSTRVDQYGEKLSTSQVAFSFWSETDKSRLYTALDRLGRHDLRGITAAIGTKSEPEVSNYLQLLKSELEVRKSSTQRNKRLLELGEIPAALEIGQRCCKVLDDAARALQRHQYQTERKTEKSRFGRYYLLTQELAEELEPLVEHDDSDLNSGAELLDEEHLQGLLPAIKLLNLPSWLELSDRVFMNLGSPFDEDNWYNITDNDFPPAIFATAFTDFHNLVVTLAKKYIAASLFQASSRIQATNPAKTKKQKEMVVKARDVRTALDILNARNNLDEYWIGLPRRCRLNVYDVGRGLRLERSADMKEIGEPLTYVDVESRLKERKWRGRRFSASSTEGDNQATPESIVATGNSSVTGGLSPAPHALQNRTLPNQDADMTEAPSAAFPNSSADESHPAATSPGDASDESEEDMSDGDSSDLETAYLNDLDRHASVQEERRLWDILDLSPPSAVTGQSLSTPGPARPKSLKLETIEKDWTERADYRAEWERYGTLLPKEAFQLTPKRDDGESEDEDDESQRGSVRAQSMPVESAGRGSRSRSSSRGQALSSPGVAL